MWREAIGRLATEPPADGPPGWCRASGARRQSIRLLIGGLWVRIPPGAPFISGIKRVVAGVGLSGSLGRRRGVTPTGVRIPHHPP